MLPVLTVSAQIAVSKVIAERKAAGLNIPDDK